MALTDLTRREDAPAPAESETAGNGLVPEAPNPPLTVSASRVDPLIPEQPLSRRSVAWRYGLSGLWFSVVLILGLSSGPIDTHWWKIAVDITTGLAMFVVIRFRRRHPLAVSLALSAMSVVSYSGFLIAVWGYISLCIRGRRRAVLLGALGVVASSVAAPLYWENLGYWTPKEGETAAAYLSRQSSDLVSWAALWVTSTVLGLYIGVQRRLTASLRERAETAEREQELRVAQGQAEERTRIAREMHDVLAHRMSLVSMHAGALEYRTDLSADEMREVAGVIQRNAHLALEELRTVLTGLRTEHDPDAPPEKPQPTLAQMADLIAEGKAAGQHITVLDEVVDIEKLPTQTGRHAYRVVQEGLTNARKHAPHAHTTITMTGSPGPGLSLRISNPRNHRGGVVPGAKVGLVGLTERATIAGGRLEHHIDDEDNFVLEVWLPW